MSKAARCARCGHEHPVHELAHVSQGARHVAYCHTDDHSCYADSYGDYPELEADDVEELRAERDALQAKLDAVYSTRATTVRGKGGLLEQLAILGGEETP